MWYFKQQQDLGPWDIIQETIELMVTISEHTEKVLYKYTLMLWDKRHAEKA